MSDFAPRLDVDPQRRHWSPEVSERLDRLLLMARNALGLDGVVLSEIQGGRLIVRALSTEFASPYEVGRARALSGSMCELVLNRSLGPLTRDTRTHPLTAGLSTPEGLAIGCLVGLPITLPSGRVYGTLCGYTAAPGPERTEAELATMHFVAQAISTMLAREEPGGGWRGERLDRMTRLVDAGGPQMVFQSITSLVSGDVYAVEALSRFEHVGGGPPQRWFDEAVSVGMGPEIELMALQNALPLFLVQPERVLSVNLSPNALCDARVLAAVAALPPRRLLIEVTEHDPQVDYSQVRDRLRDLRAEGLKVAVDGLDDGERSSLLELQPDVVKLDPSVWWDAEGSLVLRDKLAAYAGYADSEGLVLVAEGVEGADQALALWESGVRYGQGFHLGRPEPLAALTARASG